ncbi:DUF3500 domain-containing protein, partial [Streptomyces sp. MBT53]|uniref:DUF3500 domain-containing protein n=1 Tax=Streptomyces sp. MBT53 TaxID=1488384 RepID=UPI0035ABDFF6
MNLTYKKGEVAAARLSATYNDVLLGPGDDGQFPETREGIKVSVLSPKQQKLVLKAIHPWVADVDDATAKKLMKTYAHELSETYVASSGGTASTPGATPGGRDRDRGTGSAPVRGVARSCASESLHTTSWTTECGIDLTTINSSSPLPPLPHPPHPACRVVPRPRAPSTPDPLRAASFRPRRGSTPYQLIRCFIVTVIDVPTRHPYLSSMFPIREHAHVTKLGKRLRLFIGSYRVVAALACVLLPIGVLTLPAHAATAVGYFVSPGGSDDNTGTSAATPFRTLTKAQAAVRAIDTSTSGPITVTLAGGVYRLTKT